MLPAKQRDDGPRAWGGTACVSHGRFVLRHESLCHFVIRAELGPSASASATCSRLCLSLVCAGPDWVCEQSGGAVCGFFCGWQAEVDRGYYCRRTIPLTLGLGDHPPFWLAGDWQQRDRRRPERGRNGRGRAVPQQVHLASSRRRACIPLLCSKALTQ